MLNIWAKVEFKIIKNAIISINIQQAEDKTINTIQNTTTSSAESAENTTGTESGTPEKTEIENSWTIEEIIELISGVDTATETESGTTESGEHEIEYLPLTKAATKTEIEYRQLEYHFNKGEIDGYKKDNGRIMLNMDSVNKWKAENIHPLAYGDLWLEFGVYWTPILSKHYADEIFYPERYELKGRYWLSNTGQVLNSKTGKILKAATNPNGYKFVKLITAEGKTIEGYIHQMVAYYFCKGYLRCGANTVHHIDGNKKNNDYKNLIWVTSAEHGELHKLLPRDDNDKGNEKAYRKRIREIQKENNKC